MRKTKIICTIGPSSSDEKTLTAMIKAGMNVARLNFSHGTHQEHLEKMELIKKVRSDMGQPVAIMLDTKGPEYRIGTFKSGPVYLKDGQRFVFTSEDIEGDETCVSVSYKGVVTELEEGAVILVNDGLVKLVVEDKAENQLICRVETGGKLSDRKSMSFPGHVFNQVYLSKRDKEDLLFGIENGVDFVACSFVSVAQDIIDVRRFLDANGGNKIQLIAKLENQSGVDHAEEILEHCEGIMVARGDLGVEVPYIELPAIQKELIHIARRKGGISIIATEMLESMTANPRPTRAEISDVANAVYDGGSAIMLSGETAAGRYPVEAVEAMAQIALETEKHIHYAQRYEAATFDFTNLTDSISHAACQLAVDTDAACIVACTKTGQTARMISRFRVPSVVIGLTPDDTAYRQLALSWNVIPVMMPDISGTDELFALARKIVREHKFAKKGDTVVTTGGITLQNNATSLIQAEVME